MWPSRPHLTTDVLPTNPPHSLPDEPPTFWGSHAHWHDGLRTARTDRVWMGWNCVGDPLHSAPPMDGPSSGWRMIRCAMDGGWWTGAGRDRVVWDGHGWMVCSLSRSLTLPSLVSRDGWDGHGPQGVSLGVPPHPTSTSFARTTHHTRTCLPRVIHPQCMHDHKDHVATSPSHQHGCPLH